MKTFSKHSLAGKKILLTGATGGIGAAIAHLTASCGAQLILTARNESKLQQACAALPGENHLSHVADMCNHAALSNLVASLPKLDGVVYNAGILEWALCKRISEEHVRTTMQTNFESIVMLQGMLMKNKKIAGGGSIVSIASEAVFKPSIGQALYGASKAALVAYTKALALELAPQKIRANCVLPAMVQTDMATEGILDEQQLEHLAQSYPLKRLGQPQDIANLVTFLLSDAAEWMTGSSLVMDGGAQLV